MKIGSLEIEILASIDRLQKDMASVTGFMNGVERSVGRVNSVMVGLGVGLTGIFTVGGFASMIKATISATGHFNDLAATAGVGASKLMSLAKVAGFSGVSAEELAGSMNKMNLQLVKSGESGGGAAQALKAIGLNYNDFIKLSPDQRMTTVANSMASYKDGSEKSAIAMALFGKSGAALVPVLKDIASAGDLVAKATDEQIAMADHFDDNLKRLDASGGKWKQTLAMGMLPALNDATEAILAAANETGGFNDQVKQLSNDGTIDQWTRGAITGLSYLMDAFSGVGNVFKSVGLIIGAGMAQIVTYIVGGVDAAKKAIHGDFAGAMDEWGRSVAKADSITAEFNADMQKLWTDKTVGQGIRERMEATETLRKTQKELGDTTQDSKPKIDMSGLNARNEAAIEAQEKATQNLIKSGKDFVESVKTKLGIAQQDLAQNGKMTEGQKLMLDMQQKLTQGKILLTDADKKNIQVTAAAIDQKNQEIKARNDLEAAIKKESDSVYGEIQNTRKATEALKFKNDTLFMSKAQMDDLHAAELLKKADDYEALANDKERAGGMGDLAEKYREAAAALRDQAAEEKRGAVLETAKAANEEWKKTIDSIENGLTDSLMRAFESGKGFGQAFKDTLVNTFKTMILKPTLQAVVGGVFGGGSMAAAASGAAGSGGAGAGAGGILGGVASLIGMGKAAYSFLSGGALTSLSNGIVSLGAKLGSAGLQDFGGSMVGGASPFATSTTASTIGSYAGTALGYLGGIGIGQFAGRAISGGYAVGGGQSGSSAVNVGTLAGAIFGGPIGAAIGGAVGGLVNRAFGMSAKNVKERGIEGSFSAGDVAGQNYANWQQKGGWFRSDKNGVDRTDFDSATDEALSSGAMAVYEQTKVWADALKLPAERLASVTTSFKVALGDNAGANQQAVTKLFTDYQNSLASRFGGVLREFQKAGESLADTMNRLAGLQQFSAAFNEFGGVFSRIASLSVDAREQLIGFAGGIDALIGKTQSFVDAYYSDAEKFGLQSKQVAGALKDLGVDPASLQTRDQYRALVERQNIETESGRKMFSALLDIAPAFAGLAEYLTQNNMTLEQSAKQAPQTALLEALFDQSKLSANDMVDQQVLANDNLMSIEGAIRSGNQAVIDAITSSGGVMNEAVSRALSSWRDSASRAIVAA